MSGDSSVRASETSAYAAATSFAILTLSFFFVLIHLYAGIYGSPDSLFFRSLHVNIALVVVFLAWPLGGESQRPWQRAIDLLWVAGALWVQLYFAMEIETWYMRTIVFRPIDYFTSILFIFLILEATRRTVGMILVVICLVFLCHALFSNHFPGIFYGPPSSLKNLLQGVFLDSNGIFGVAVAVMANFVVLFILFGTLLNACGGGQFFTRLAFALFGHRVGGPAKAAVVSSAMMGSLSGSAIGNVLTTGAFTIPLMIRLGYKRAFAAGVEAAASNGGIIMPPVMGAVAFIMAEFLDRPYVEIIFAALIPALLYFLVIFVTVHAEARKNGLATMPRDRLPRAWALLKREGYLLFPVLLIVIALIMGYSIVFVAVLVTAGTFAIAVIQPRNRLRPLLIPDIVDETVRATVSLSVTAAAAGVILGAIFAVGLSFQVAQAAAETSQGYLWVLLLLTALMSIIMGLGMTAPAIYLTLVATIIPILITAGVPPIAAHFFAFYYGNLSGITPPVALTAYAAAPIARTGPLGVGVQASRLGAASFILPILFIYEPGLLLVGDPLTIARVAITSALGLIAFSVSVTGYAFAPMPVWQRIGGAFVCFLAIVPELWSDLAGIVVGLIVFGSNFMSQTAAPRSASKAPETEEDEPRVAWLSAISRSVESRVRREDTVPEAPGTRETDVEALLAQVIDDADSKTVTKPTPAELWWGWGVFTVAGLLFAAQGHIFLHARAPIWWACAQFGLAVVLALATVFGRHMLAGHKHTDMQEDGRSRA